LSGEALAPPPRQERSRRKREALLASALEVFGRRGFDGATVEEIARRAAVAVGGFYAHFGSKRQALLVLMDRLLGEIDAMGTEEVPPGAERAAVRALVAGGLRVDRAYADAYRAWREASAGDAELGALDARIDAWAASRVAAFVRQLGQAPEARLDIDVETTAWVITALFWRLTEVRLERLEPVEAAVGHLVERALFRDRPDDRGET